MTDQQVKVKNYRTVELTEADRGLLLQAYLILFHLDLIERGRNLQPMRKSKLTLEMKTLLEKLGVDKEHLL